MKKRYLFLYGFLLLVISFASAAAYLYSTNHLPGFRAEAEPEGKKQPVVASGNTAIRKMPVRQKKMADQKRYPPAVEKRMQENRLLLEEAQSGRNETIQYVRLTRENRYMDRVADNLFLTRDATSGPGTGRFVGGGFVFCKGSCDEVLKEGGETKGPPIRWFKKINQCRERILENDWCALSKSNKQEAYTVKILSWPIEQSDCTGDCAEHDYQTAYIRIKSR